MLRRCLRLHQLLRESRRIKTLEELTIAINEDGDVWSQRTIKRDLSVLVELGHAESIAGKGYTAVKISN